MNEHNVRKELLLTVKNVLQPGTSKSIKRCDVKGLGLKVEQVVWFSYSGSIWGNLKCLKVTETASQ